MFPRQAGAGRIGRAGRRAFSLLELLIALLLVSLTATASIWAYFSRAEVTLENAARLLVQDLRLAQGRAALLRTPVSVVFRLEGEGYEVVPEGAAAHAESAEWKPIVRLYARDAVFEGVRIEGVEASVDREVRFDEHGLVTSSARVRLAYRGETRTLEIEEGRGRIRIADFSTPLVDDPR